MTSKAIGIDLGTTYSCVGVFKNNRVEIIANNFNGSRTMPSCVAFTDDEILVGEVARIQLASNAENTVYGVKRMIGRRFADQCVQDDMKHWPFKVAAGKDGQAMVEVKHEGETKQYTPEHISSLVLGKLKLTAEKYMGHEVTDAVITIPANYGDAQRQATFEAARLAGLNVLRIVNEPTAAALAYGFENIVTTDKPRTVLVFDLGGGTLDVSILSVDKNNEFEVKATAGNSHLGGDDFDNRMLAYFSQEFKHKHKKDLSDDKRAVRRLYAVCESTKRVLSENDVGRVAVDSLHKGQDFESKTKRENFNELCADLFQNTIAPVDKALKDAKLSKEAIDEIVLVGGSSRVPKVYQLVAEYFEGQRMNKSINPDEAIAYGAALLAAKLSNVAVPSIQRIKLSDITSASLSIENYLGQCNIIIPRGTRTPVTITQEQHNAVGYKTAAPFKVYEGEDPLAVNNRFLGSFTIMGFPALPAGQVKFDVVMEIDANGILHVSATEKSTGKKNQISFSRRVVA